MEESVRTLLDSRLFQEQAKKLYAQALMLEMQVERLPDFHLQPEKLLSSAQVLQMVGVELLEQGHVEESQPLLERASELYEYLERAIDYPVEIRLELLFLAAVTASLSGQQANAYVLSKNLPQEIERLAQDLNDSYAAYTILAILILRRQFAKAWSYATAETASLVEREQQLKRRLKGEGSDDASIDPLIAGWRFLCFKRYLQGCQLFLRYATSGDVSLFDQAIDQLNWILEIFLREGDVEYWYMVNALRALLQRIKERSLWTTAYAKLNCPLVYQYCYSLVNPSSPDGESLLELWHSQLQAIERGLLHSLGQNVIVRLPTSAGKTRIAEMAILANLSQHPDRLCIYVAPYRALVESVRISFDHTFTPLGFRVSSVLGEREFVREEGELALSVDILIITPEKLDLLLRRWPNILQRAGMVVFDEGHIIGDETRGLRSEFLLARLIRQGRKYGFGVVFMSAVIPDLEDLKSWLNVNSRLVLSSGQRPNRQMVGQFAWFNEKNRQDPNGKYGRIIYLNNEAAFIPRVIERKDYHLSQPPLPGLEFIGDSVTFPSSHSDTLAALALRYAKLGPVLVFAPTVPKVKAVCESIDKALNLVRECLVDDVRQESLNDLASEVEQYLGQHTLGQWIRCGFAAHHANLPQNVRLLIEEGFRQENLRILVATNTLAQGVNLPIKTIIVGGVVRKKSDYVPLADYKNIVGRAGRANYETEGNVILCLEKLPPKIRKQYLQVDPQVETVFSQLYALYDELVKTRLNLQIRTREEALRRVGNQNLSIPVYPSDGDDAHPIDAELFAILAEEAFDPDDEASLFEILGSTLFAHQCSRLEINYKPFAAYLSARLKIVRDKFLREELQTTYYQTGLSLKSCAEITRILEEEKPACISEILSGQVDAPHILDLVRIALRAEAVDVDEKRDGILSTVLPRWLQGEDIEQIVRAAVISISGTSAEDVCKALYTDIAQWLSWAVGGVLLIAAHTYPGGGEDALPDLAKLIPAFLKYGVNTRPAVWACILGVKDREAAIRLGRVFEISQAQYYFEVFANWLSNLNYPEVCQVFDGDGSRALRVLRQIQVMPQDKSLRRFLQTGQDEISIKAPVGSNPAFYGDLNGERLTIRRDEHNPDPINQGVFTQDGRLVGYIARSYSVWIAQLPSNIQVVSEQFDPNRAVITLRVKRHRGNPPFA